jgi:DNA-binding SARP family transcriptional activator
LTRYNRALDHWRKTGNVVQQANLLNNLGVLYHLNGNYEQARLLLEEALDCARRSGYVRMEAFTLSSIGDLYADLNAPEAALDAYRQAHEASRRIDERFLLLYLDLGEAALSRSTGDLSQAHTLIESARQLAQESGSNFEQALWQLEAGRLALAERDTLGAIAPLEEAACCFDHSGQRVEAARAHLYLAAACQTNGDEKAAKVHLSHACHLAADLESQHILIVAGRDAKALLEAVQSDPAVGRQASRLLRQVVQFEQAIPALRRRLRRRALTVPFAPPRLTFQALGSNRVLVDGRQVTGADWQALVARDLLFCLLAHPDGLTKEAIGLIFWPESSPAQLKLQFKQTVYRLRRALGQDVVLLDQDRYQFNRALDYECDVETFMEKLAQARAATDPGERAAAYRAAVDLYRGPYLPEVDGTWVCVEQERLWQAYVEAVLALAQFHLVAREYGVALDYCQRALDVDLCLEEAHRLAMRAHAALGNRAGVARQYERCRQALQEELCAPLSPQTEALYDTLIRR